MTIGLPAIRAGSLTLAQEIGTPPPLTNQR